MEFSYFLWFFSFTTNSAYLCIHEVTALCTYIFWKRERERFSFSNILSREYMYITVIWKTVNLQNTRQFFKMAILMKILQNALIMRTFCTITEIVVLFAKWPVLSQDIWQYVHRLRWQLTCNAMVLIVISMPAAMVVCSSIEFHKSPLVGVKLINPFSLDGTLKCRFEKC